MIRRGRCLGEEEVDASLGRPAVEPDSIQINSTEASHWELHSEPSSEIGSHAEETHLLCLFRGRRYSGNSQVVEQLSELTWRDLTDATGKL